MAPPSLPSACATCGAALAGPFCAQCGQKVRAGRLTLASVLQETAQQVLSLDSGLLRTAVDLVRRPAGLIRDVFAGRTVRYAGPVRYFLIAVTVAQVLALAVGGLDEIASGFNSARRSGEALADASDVQRFWVVALAGAVPFVALWSRLLLRRAGLTLAEHLAAYLYLVGQILLGFGLMIVVEEAADRLLGAEGYWIGLTVFGATLAVALWASVGVFRRGPAWSPLAMALSLVLGYAAYGFVVTGVLAALGRA